MNTQGKRHLMKESEVDDEVDLLIHQSWREYPELISELDQSKNIGLMFRGKSIKAFELKCGTHTKLDWKCMICEHEWKASGSSRVNGRGCPACVNKVIHIDGRNSMAITHPELALEYQGDATKIITGTNKKLDWKCSDCDHEWKATGKDRRQGKGCPACSNNEIHIDGRNSMAITHPELALEYQGDATKIIAGTHTKLDWECMICEHEWKAIGSSRVNGRGCPACSNRVIHTDGRNSMAKTHPELAIEYLGDATKVIATGRTKLDWKCSDCGHIWMAVGSNRVRGAGCPACSNNEIHIDGRNSMAITHPELALEYQGDATKIIAGTNKKLDWKCSDCEHEWKAKGIWRFNGNGCPACSNHSLHIDGRNSMAGTHPELAVEYQGDATKIIAGTHTKLNWKCSDCGYEWKATGKDRITGRGCSVCSKYGFDPSKVGYLYIHLYSVEEKNWLKCGITNNPLDRFQDLRNSANKFNIEVFQMEIYKFDDGYNASNCEKELLSLENLRFLSDYDIDGKTEFFKIESLETIKNVIQKWI